MKRITLGAIGAILISTTLIAHEHASGVVLDRMNAMMTFGSVMKSVSPVLKGEAEPNFKDLKTQGAVMSTALVVIKQSFPEGSTDDASEASPKIWEDAAGFEAKLTELETIIAGFNAAVGSEDAEAVQASLKSFAGTCKACHEAYRVKK